MHCGETTAVHLPVLLAGGRDVPLDDMGEGGAPVVGPLLKAIFAAPDPGAPCSIGLT